MAASAARGAHAIVRREGVRDVLATAPQVIWLVLRKVLDVLGFQDPLGLTLDSPERPRVPPTTQVQNTRSLIVITSTGRGLARLRACRLEPCGPCLLKKSREECR
jgi:hypothetical protein